MVKYLWVPLLEQFFRTQKDPLHEHVFEIDAESEEKDDVSIVVGTLTSTSSAILVTCQSSWFWECLDLCLEFAWVSWGAKIISHSSKLLLSC